jgi:hypothetical protein
MTENAKGKGAVMAHDPLADLDPEAASRKPWLKYRTTPRPRQLPPRMRQRPPA